MDFVCTLYEKHYDYGVGALCNSLVAANFEGKIIIGYKQKLPFWLNQLQQGPNKTYLLSKKINIELVNLDHIEYHLGYYKAQFMIECINQNRELETISYFDPDITIKANWLFFKKWITAGVALAADNCYPFFHINHPWRRDWDSLFPEKEVISKPECYVNSGFIGLRKTDREILMLWQEAIHQYQLNKGNLYSFERNAESSLKGDQDLLNAALMYFPYEKLSVIGMEAMGFKPPHYIMGHAISGTKPWKKNYLKELIVTGHKPSFAEKIFFINALNPIKIFTKISFVKKKINLALATILGRII